MALCGTWAAQAKWIPACLIGLLWVATPGWGQATVPATTLEQELRAMSDAAGVIFAGQVVAVRRGAGVVEVEFRVDQAVRGCTAGEPYVLREWAGLWSGGDARYRVGQRLMMLLRSPGAGGLSSPVGGMDGAIPIRGVESAIGPEADVAGNNAGGGTVAGSSVSAGAGPVAQADLRWVGRRVLRAAGSTAAQVTAATAGSPGPDGSVAAEGASVDALVGMLRDWEAARAGR